jgi:hypothetical protein
MLVGLQIDIDEAALRLGVVRRRMYDIINVFEGIEVVQRRSRGQYTWFGFDKLPDVIRRQKIMGPLDFSQCEESEALSSVINDDDLSEIGKPVCKVTPPHTPISSLFGFHGARSFVSVPTI